MGEGETANRATADNMSRNLVDSVKDLQQVMEIFVNEHVIKELLLESTFGDAVLDEENLVRLKFKEIDVDAQIKKENHHADLFEKDILNHDEARIRMGLEPWVIPTPEEVQNRTDTPDNFPEWNKSRWKMFKEPELLIQSIDEPYSPAALAASQNNSLGVTPGDLDESAKKTNEQEMALEQERTKAKVAVAKAKPAVTRRDGFLNSTFIQIKQDTVERVSIKQTLDQAWVASLIRAQMNPTIGRLVSEQLLAFRKGYARFGSIEDERFANAIKLARISLQERAERFIHRLTENVISSLKRNVKEDTENKAQVTRAVFDSVEFRTRFIEDVEVRKAENFGHAVAVRNIKGVASMTSITTNDSACAKCLSRDGQMVFLGLMTLDDVPPHHAHCNCTLEEPQSPTLGIQDGTVGSADDPTDVVPETEVQPCPECGKTAVRTKNTADIFNCKACGHAFQMLKDDDVEDGRQTKYLKCRTGVKRELRSAHPEWTQDRINAAAESACIHLLVTDNTEEIDPTIEDATLEECVLSTKKSLRKQHPDWSADRVKSSAFAICNSRMKGK
jgi:ribosomal protein L37AE/L43A